MKKKTPILKNSNQVVAKVSSARRLNPPRLNEIMKYKNHEVVARFCKDLGVTQRFGNKVFKDMLGFLYISATVAHFSELRAQGKKMKREVPRKAPLLESMLIIDEMWHTFVLYTPEYEAFSKKYFGFFLHHIPTPTLKSKKKKNELLTKADIEAYLEFVWDELGEDFVDRWFTEYPRLYSKKKIRMLQLKTASAA